MRKARLHWLMLGLALTGPWWHLAADEGRLLPAVAEHDVDFQRDIEPLLVARCFACHGPETQKGGFRLDRAEAALGGGDQGAAIVPGKSAESRLVHYVAGTGELPMPPKGERLTRDQVGLVRKWIDQGAKFPAEYGKQPAESWWSLRPLSKPVVPSGLSENPVDAFIDAKLLSKKLRPTSEADRRTLFRRVHFDLLGLPPDPDEVERFVQDPDPRAYEKLVDRLLASPHYGERAARRWLDLVHYGDTHGYDKDKPRTNAWPYRDYVIRAFNEDKPYHRFVEEQLAGDVLYPHTRDGVEALGFIAAGPWDFIGHVEVPESKIDGKIARHLDRDDMVANTMNTFVSLTVQCAQCHNHKFDPIPQEDYYRLQAVFAALDRTDRRYYAEPHLAKQAHELDQKTAALKGQLATLEQQIATQGGTKLAELERRLANAEASAKLPKQPAASGYHSKIETAPERFKWVQVDLGKPMPLARLEFVGAYDTYSGIGAGFGFPLRYQIDASNDAKFKDGVTRLLDRTETDQHNPGIEPRSLVLPAGLQARYVRFTATHLASRGNDYIFALAELRLFDSAGSNLALGKPVEAVDGIDAPPRWQKSNLVDGVVPVGIDAAAASKAAEQRRLRDEHLERTVNPALLGSRAELARQLGAVQAEQAKLPPPRLVYAGGIHSGTAPFRGTGPDGGLPRPIFVLTRGDVRKPGKEVGPGALSCVVAVPAEFGAPECSTEGQRRVALARWIVNPKNPLTWRSIVNRVWRWHFGRGLVETPSDFGRMGQQPTHPELLDWLAVEFRDGGQSFKKLDRLLVTSAAYRRSSQLDPVAAKADGENVWLWRMPRRKLEAEELRDAMLAVSGTLDRRLFGPPFQDFVIEKPEHSPHYQYHLHDPADPRSHRRSIYRFLVRSQQQPFMAALDCADPSMQVDRRNETLSALQALVLLNDGFTLTMAKRFAERLERSEPEEEKRIRLAVRLALGREPTQVELLELANYQRKHGLANTCRLLFNLNEFAFVD